MNIPLGGAILERELTDLIAMSKDSSESESASVDSTAELTRRWRSGDLAAFERVVDRFSGPLLSYVLSKINHLQDGEDIVQETLIRAHRSVHQLRDENRMWLWLKQIAHNATMDALKRARRWGIPTSSEEIQEMELERKRNEGGSHQDDLNMETIVAAIETLPDTYRLTAIYYYLEEWPYAKIAEVLGIDQATVRQRISRVTKLLRESLKKVR